jgi:hypothetical protein
VQGAQQGLRLEHALREDDHGALVEVVEPAVAGEAPYALLFEQRGAAGDLQDQRAVFAESRGVLRVPDRQDAHAEVLELLEVAGFALQDVGGYGFRVRTRSECDLHAFGVAESAAPGKGHPGGGFHLAQWFLIRSMPL